MFGDESDEGIIPRVCRNLMSGPRVQLSFKVTYIEIFLEKVRDLLVSNNSSSAPNLRVREHPTDGPFVDGALCVEVQCLEDCMNYIKLGNQNRMTASTKLNLQSSRSHAIFTIHCSQTKVIDTAEDPSNPASPFHGLLKKEDNEKSYTVVSKLNLIDLAGSENSLAAGTEGDRLKEGAAINKSLLTLGRVIKILAENSQKERKIPTQNLPNSGSRRRHSMLERSSSDRNLGNTPPTGKNSDKRSSLSPQSSRLPNVSSGSSTPTARTTPPRSRGSTLTLVPYRDSVLTYLLKESLGGNSKTTMIATIRPGS